MSSNVEITVKSRTAGTSKSNKLRRDGQVPAVVYGPNIKNLNLSVGEIEYRRYSSHKFDNAIFVFKSDDKELNGLKVLKKSYSIHPVTRRPTHVDFYALDMKKAVKVNIEIRYTGKAEGTKEGGVFNILRRDVEIECLPTEIPEAFEVDVTNLKLNEALHVSDIKIPSNFKLITSDKEAIASVAEVKEEVIVAPVAADAAAVPGAEGAAAAPGAPGAAAPGAPGAAAPAAAPTDDKKKKE